MAGDPLERRRLAVEDDLHVDAPVVEVPRRGQAAAAVAARARQDRHGTVGDVADVPREAPAGVFDHAR